jgi:hypothetical protein
MRARTGYVGRRLGTKERVRQRSRDPRMDGLVRPDQ